MMGKMRCRPRDPINFNWGFFLLNPRSLCPEGLSLTPNRFSGLLQAVLGQSPGKKTEPMVAFRGSGLLPQQLPISLVSLEL